LGFRSQRLTKGRQALRKFILIQPPIKLGYTKAQAGQSLAALLLVHPESLGWLPHGLDHTTTFLLVGFSATATQFHEQRMRICLRLLEQIMASVTEQQHLIFLTTMTIGLLAHRLHSQPRQTMKVFRPVGELLLGFSFMNHLATQPTALTPLTQQA
jgi:hypothetical protein